MPRGTADPDIGVDIYQSDKAWPGTTLFGDNYNPERPRIIEVNMLGQIVWEYLIPDRKNWPVRDANRLPNGNTLITGATEIVEVAPEGRIVWRLRLQGVSFTLQEAAGRDKHSFRSANVIRIVQGFRSGLLLSLITSAHESLGSSQGFARHLSGTSSQGFFDSVG